MLVRSQIASTNARAIERILVAADTRCPARIQIASGAIAEIAGVCGKRASAIHGDAEARRFQIEIRGGRLSLEQVRKRKAASRRAPHLLREYPRNLGIAGGFLADRKSGLSQDDHRDGTRSRFLQQLKRVVEEYRLI